MKVQSNNRAGFTLVEVLMASILILMIISMVYAGYVTTTTSAKLCEQNMIRSRGIRLGIAQMTRQIRGAYLPSNDSAKNETDIQESSHNPMYFFKGGNKTSNTFLEFVTINGIADDNNKAEGLVKVAYRYNKPGSVILRLQKPVNTIESTGQTDTKWDTVAEGVAGIELEFYDGYQWHNQWSSDKDNGLPTAVKISIIITNGAGCQETITTTTRIYCGFGRSKDTLAKYESIAD
jgi:type II secretion system protein J